MPDKTYHRVMLAISFVAMLLVLIFGSVKVHGFAAFMLGLTVGLWLSLELRNRV